MGKAIRTAALVFLLAGSAQAGYIPNGNPTPPPQSPSTVAEPVTQPEPTDDSVETPVADTLVELALTVLVSALS